MFQIFDIVWCSDSKQAFVPGSIMLDPKKQLWQNGDRYFVKLFLDGTGSLSKGRWYKERDICHFFKLPNPMFSDENLRSIVCYANTFDLRKCCSVNLVPYKTVSEKSQLQNHNVKKIPQRPKLGSSITAVAKKRPEKYVEEPCELEQIAKRNREMLNQLLKPLMQKSSELSSVVSAPPSVVHRVRTPRPVPYSRRDEPPVTRSGKLSSSISTDPSVPASQSLKRVKKERTYRRSMPARWAIDPNTNVLSPENVTQEMLDGVCHNILEKVYNKVSGSSCHQCRQKTVDTKTICRSGRCSGVRGHFCGVCLYTRYGEIAEEALKNPSWKCPPCRGVCNCSICRNNEGKCATGPAFYKARANGFESVMHYLASKEDDFPTEEENDSSEEGVAEVDTAQPIKTCDAEPKEETTLCLLS